MHFASDNTSGVAPEILAALSRANAGYMPSYGEDPISAAVTEKIRKIFDAPEAEVHLVATGTAANCLSLAAITQPGSAIFCHTHAHIEEDEGGAPEFFTNGGKLITVAGDHGRIDPALLRARIASIGTAIHSVARGAVSMTNVTEVGTVYTPAAVAAITAEARAFDLPVHMDGARFANAVIATGANPADLSWRAGVDLLSFGGTKNGCMGVEAVVIFDPAKAPAFALRRKRGGHLVSKYRFLAAQFDAYLEDGLWLRLARQANDAAAALAHGLSQKADVTLLHPVEANELFLEWPVALAEKLRAEGAAFYGHDIGGGREAARLVTGWSTTRAEVEAFLSHI